MILTRRTRAAGGTTRQVWPMLAVLLLVVLGPTVCMLWFLAAAVNNTNLAVRQRLTDVYRGQVFEARRALAAYWKGQLGVLEGSGDLPPGARFRHLVTASDFDGAVVRGQSASTSYPGGSSSSLDPLADDPNWLDAQRLEFERSDPAAAAEAYAELARRLEQSDRARALRARARCLAKAGHPDRALAVLTGPLASAELSGAADPTGRLIAPDAAIFALQLLRDANAPAYRKVAEGLRKRLGDYSRPVIPSGQRLFLMGELRRLAGGGAFATQAAEQCTAEYLGVPQQQPAAGRLTRAAGEGLWHVASGDGRTVGICRGRRLAETARRVCVEGGRLTGITIELVGPSEPASRDEPLLAVAAPAPLVGWEVHAHLRGGDPFAAAAGRQKSLYTWAAVLGIGVVLTSALIVAGYLGRQMKLARLKNDLIATVSHELKTPLSSMRVLVDTLVEDRCTNEQQVREYCALIAKENERLSRVIDNFLAFSRMERNKAAFELVEVGVADVVAAAAEAMRERLARPGAHLQVDVAADLPPVLGDRDALITVVVNLLDNACKYSGEDKRIALRAYAEANRVCLEVSDNGVGMTRRAAKRIFERFYQADQRLARAAGGCGLGLSIVRFIVDAHGGTIGVASRPGEGSTFTVRLPAAGHGAAGVEGRAGPAAS